MADDARISIALPEHPKTKKLIRRIGVEGAWFLVKLFLWAASNRHDGDLSGLTAEDIELAINWPGEIGAFVKTLVEVGFLDGEEGQYTIHDWYEHNTFAATKGLRVERARTAANKRWGGQKDAVPLQSSDANGMQGACVEHANGMRSDGFSNALHSTPLHTTPPKSKSKALPGNTSNRVKGNMPDGFAPKDSHVDLARKLGVNLDAEFVKFLDYHGSKGSTFKNWDLALNTWLRNASEFSRGKSPPSKQPQSLSKTAEDLDDWVERQKRGER